MKRVLLAALLGVFAAAFAQETPINPGEAFEVSFTALLQGERLAQDPGVWLMRNRAMFDESLMAGADAGTTAAFAARLMREWDLDVRSGLSLQEADARARQAFRVTLREGIRGQRRIEVARGSTEPGEGVYGRGAIAGSGPGGFPYRAGTGARTSR